MSISPSKSYRTEVEKWVEKEKNKSKIRLTKKSLENFLANYNIGHLLKFQKIAKGFANQVYILKTSKGQFILKIIERNNPYRVRYEVDLLNHLKGLPTPRPIKTTKGEYLANFATSNKAFIYHYLSGNQRTLFNKTMLRQVGRFLAKFHLQTKNFKSKIIRIEFYNITPRLLKRMIKVSGRLKDDQVTEQLPYIKKNLLRYSLPKSLPQGAMHIDLKPENVLFKKGRITGVVDFDNSYIGPLVLDLANTMMWFCSKKGKFNISQALAIYRSYQQTRKLTKQEKRHFFEALHYAFLNHVLIDIYSQVYKKLSIAYVRWGIANLLETEKNLNLSKERFNSIFN